MVIRTRAVSLNYRDTDIVAGTYPFKFPLPLVPTSDGVGEVVAVGEGVTRAKVGDRVLGTFWQSSGSAVISTRPRPSANWAATWTECYPRFRPARSAEDLCMRPSI